MIIPVGVVGRCLVIGMLGVSVGCGKPSAGPAPQTSAAAPDVAVVSPERRTLVRVIEQPAHVEAYEETPLVARLSGYVHKVHVDIGDRVRGPRYDAQGKEIQAGQVLAELWVPEVQEEHRQKQALEVQAEAEVEQTQAAWEVAEANVTTAKALVREAEASRSRAQANRERWESEFKRIEDLVQRKVIDAQTRDETRHQYKAAEAACQEVEAKVHSAQALAKESEAKRHKARADVTAARAHVQVAQAEAARLKALLQYSQVRAPFDGVVTRRNIHSGHFLQPSTGIGSPPLFVVARTDIVRVLVDVPEADAMYVSDGVPARIRVHTLKEQELEGKVTRSSWSLDPKSRTLRTEIDLPNPQGKLRPGTYAYVALRAEFPHRLTLPVSAVAFASGGQPYCFLVENGKAIRTPIQLGLRDAMFVEVLKKQKKTGAGNVAESFTGEEVVVQGNLSSLNDGHDIHVATGKAETLRK